MRSLATPDLSFLEVVDATPHASFVEMLLTLQSHLHLHPRFKRLGSKTCIQTMGGNIKCKVNKSLEFVVQNESVELYGDLHYLIHI